MFFTDLASKASSYHRSVVLGGAQLGLRYGICHSHFLSKVQLYELLDKAYYLGFRNWDLAQAYGSAELRMAQWLGKRLCKRRFYFADGPGRLQIGTKIASGSTFFETRDLQRSRSCFSRSGLGLSYVLLHTYNSYEIAGRLRSLQSSCRVQESKKKGSGGKTGVSLYYPYELEDLLEQIDCGQCPGIDIIQLPYSVADRRFEAYFPQLQQMGISLQLRSLYLQGVLLSSAETLAEGRLAYFRPLLPLLEGMAELEKRLQQAGLPVFRQDLLLLAGLRALENAEERVKKRQEQKGKRGQLVLGVSSTGELLQLHRSLHRLHSLVHECPDEKTGMLRQFDLSLAVLGQQAAEISESILVPALWPR